MRHLSPIAFALIAVFVLTPLAIADDEPVDTTRIQIWARGDDRRELDVTDMGAGALEQLHEQMTEKGYRLVESRELLAFSDGRIESTVQKTKTTVGEGESVLALGDPDLAREEPDVRRDLRELLRGGGRLPEGFVPHGKDDPDAALPPWWTPGPNSGPPRDQPFPPGAAPGPGPEVHTALLGAAGKILLRYLDAKDDPVRRGVYASVLGDLAEAMVAVSEDGQAGAAMLATRLLPKVMAGFQDPAKAAVFEEILEILMEALAPAGSPHAPGERPESGRWPSPTFGPSLGGAPLAPRPMGDRIVLEVSSVPAGSIAEEMTLSPGDRILAVDGRPVAPEDLIAARERISRGGQLTLRVLRKTGETEVLELEFARDEGR